MHAVKWHASIKELTQCGDVVQLVRTPACHVGGRGFEPRRPRHLFLLSSYSLLFCPSPANIC